MRLTDITPGEVFIFSDSPEAPMLKTETGFYDFLEEDHSIAPLKSNVIPVDKSVAWRQLAKYEIYQAEVEKITKEVLESYKEKSKVIEINKRDIYFFSCQKCGKKRRVTLKKEKAEMLLCRKCRKLSDDKRQQSLFPLIVEFGGPTDNSQLPTTLTNDNIDEFSEELVEDSDEEYLKKVKNI